MQQRQEQPQERWRRQMPHTPHPHPQQLQKPRPSLAASLAKKSAFPGSLFSSSKGNGFEVYDVLSPAMPIPVNAAQKAASSDLDYCDRWAHGAKTRDGERKVASAKEVVCRLTADPGGKAKGNGKDKSKRSGFDPCVPEVPEENLTKKDSREAKYTPKKFVSAPSRAWNPYLQANNLGYFQYLAKHSPFKLPFQLSYKTTKFFDNFSRVRNGLGKEPTFPALQRNPKKLTEGECDEIPSHSSPSDARNPPHPSSEAELRDYLHSTWLSLDGQLTHMKSAIEASGVSENFDGEAKLAWEAFTPLQRIITVAASTAAIASGKDEMRKEVSKLKRAVEAREHALKLMRRELRNKQRKESLTTNSEGLLSKTDSDTSRVAYINEKTNDGSALHTSTSGNTPPLSNPNLNSTDTISPTLPTHQVYLDKGKEKVDDYSSIDLSETNLDRHPNRFNSISQSQIIATKPLDERKIQYKSDEKFDFKVSTNQSYDSDSTQAVKKSKTQLNPFPDMIQEISPIEPLNDLDAFRIEDQHYVSSKLANDKPISNVQRDVSVLISSLNLIVQKLNDFEKAQTEYARQKNCFTAQQNSKAMSDLFKTLEKASAWLCRLENTVSNSHDSFNNYFRYPLSNGLDYKAGGDALNNYNTRYSKLNDVEAGFPSDAHSNDCDGIELNGANSNRASNPHFNSSSSKSFNSINSSSGREIEKLKEKSKNRIPNVFRLFSNSSFTKKTIETTQSNDLLQSEFASNGEEERMINEPGVKILDIGESNTNLKSAKIISETDPSFQESEVKFDLKRIENWKKKSQELFEPEIKTQMGTLNEDEDPSRDGRNHSEDHSIVAVHHNRESIGTSSTSKWMNESENSRWQDEIIEMEEMQACLQNAMSSLFKMMWGKQGGFKGLVERLTKGENESKEKKNELFGLMHTMASEIAKVESFSRKLKTFIHESQQKHSDLLNESNILKDAMKEKEGRLEEVMNASRMIDESYQQKLDELQTKCSGKNKKIKELKKEIKSLSAKIAEQNDEILSLKEALKATEKTNEDIVWRVGLPLLERNFSMDSNDGDYSTDGGTDADMNRDKKHNEDYPPYVDAESPNRYRINQRLIQNTQNKGFISGGERMHGRLYVEESDEYRGIGKGRMVRGGTSVNAIKERETKRIGKGEGNEKRVNLRESLNSNHPSNAEELGLSSSISSQIIHLLSQSMDNLSSTKSSLNFSHGDKHPKLQLSRKPLFPNPALHNEGKESLDGGSHTFSQIYKENLVPYFS